MNALPYLEVYSKVEDVFGAIRTLEVPNKFTYRYLAGIGFSSSKDRGIVPFLTALNLVSSSGRPTEYYFRLKSPAEFVPALQELIRFAYDELFRLEAAAENVPENVLDGYFGKLTGADIKTCKIYSATFRELIKISQYTSREVVSEKTTQAKKVDHKISPRVSLSINLPSTTDEKVYESLFKHLKDFLTP